MEFIRRQFRFVMRLSVGEKIGLLLVLNNLDENIQRSYARICHEQECKSLVVVSRGNNNNNRKQSRKNKQGSLELFPKLFRSRFKVYTSISNILFVVNLVKYSLVAFIMATKLLPKHLICYLPGRLFLTSILSHVNLELSIPLLILILLWHHIATRPDNSHELLNMLIFLLSDDKLIDRERDRVRTINNRNLLSIQEDDGGTGSGGELSSILQKALFYELTTSDGQIVYRLRPNRTRYYKQQLGHYVDKLYATFLGMLVTYAMMIVPVSLLCWFADKPYQAIYPSCCGASNFRLWPQSFGVVDGFHVGCGQRLYSLAFDFLDSSALIISSSLIYLVTFWLSTTLTTSLVLHWRLIDRRIVNLSRRYKRKLLGPNLELMRLPTTRRKFMVASDRRHSNQSYLSDYEKSDLQTQILDFFNSFKRINRTAGSLVGFTFLLFFSSILSFAYFSYRTPGYYQTLLAKYFVVVVYSMFLANAIIVLQLNRVINKSYANICSLMAADGSAQAMKWIQIVDIFSSSLGTSYSVLGWRLNWHIITSMMASSISFLFIVETYKRKNTEPFGGAI